MIVRIGKCEFFFEHSIFIPQGAVFLLDILIYLFRHKASLRSYDADIILPRKEGLLKHLF